jgi:hypothetical protein
MECGGLDIAWLRRLASRATNRKNRMLRIRSLHSADEPDNNRFGQLFLVLEGELGSLAR